MSNDPTELAELQQTFETSAYRLLETIPADPVQADPGNSPHLLVDAMRKVLQLLEVMENRPTGESDSQITEHDIHQLGDYGFNLLGDLSSIAGSHKLNELSQELENLCLPFAIWIARRGGQISTLEPIVNAISYQANAVREPIDLERLYELTGEIQDAVIPALRQDLEKSNPGRPWRILLLNRAIIATRSHNLSLIEHAYDSLLQQLPEEAPGFFQEGMQQMLALDYPQPVRNLVENYYKHWSVERTRH